MNDASILDLTAEQLTAAYAAGELSPLRATEAVLRRIELTDPQLNAFCLVEREGALAQARVSEERWRRHEPLGPVDGVPCSIKDMLLTAGSPTLRGSRTVRQDQPWVEDAPAVARLRESGAVLIGKTTTPEFAWKAVTDSPLTGVTRNPWDPTRTPGGSSGGASAAVAAGAGPLAVGTDGGGSIRVPAAFSGVVGVKPTYGRVPAYPASPFGTLSHVGPLTRTVADTAALLDVVCAPDSRDWSALAPPVGRFRDALQGTEGLRGMRVAYCPDFDGRVSVHPEVEQRVHEAVQVMERLGALVERVDPPMLTERDPVEAFHTLWFAGAAKVLEQLPEERFQQLDPGLRDICAQGAGVTALEYLGAVRTREALGVAMGRFHETWDLLVTPSVPVPPFEAGREVPSSAGNAERSDAEKSTRWTSWAPFSYPFNMTQQPALSLPCGLADGLPVGVQLVGPRHADARVLRAAHAMESAGVGCGQRPPMPRD